MTSKARTERSSKSNLIALVERDGLLLVAYQGRDTTNEDAKLLMSTAILAGTEVEGRRANLVVKNLMELVTSYQICHQGNQEQKSVHFGQ